ncbi:MAG: DNA cytosine methyltransferase [Candidatus Hydrogenedens sp.]|jgi:DNA (cytosine-5)-methyltransferase 1|nr:DNA cytosine methyltransferase [Candidatus Hydrogenedens sp.]
MHKKIVSKTLETDGHLIDQKRNNNKLKCNKRMRVMSFFSGAMGLDIGLEKAGLEIVLASEIDPKCKQTIKANRPSLPVVGDIRNYSAADLLAHAGINKSQEVDLIAGGPPCQAFSTAGNRRGFEDERGNVFLKYIDIILEIRPKYAMIENVRGLLSAPLAHRPHNKRGFGFPPLTPDEEKGGALFHILSQLKKGGYSVSFNLYNAANFGTPQVRERVILLCSRDREAMPYLSPTCSETGDYNLPKWKTFREAVDGLSYKEALFIPFPEKRLRFYRLLTAGQNWRNLPEPLQKEALGRAYYVGGGKTGFLRRLAWDKPSPTLVTHPAMPATDLAHPEEDRPLSVQEYKRIQEFPDDWVIAGSLVDQYRQIGNAVPVSLGEAVGRTLVAHDQGAKIVTYPNFQYSRYCNTSDDMWLQDFLRRSAEQNQLELFTECSS